MNKPEEKTDFVAAPPPNAQIVDAVDKPQRAKVADAEYFAGNFAKADAKRAKELGDTGESLQPVEDAAPEPAAAPKVEHTLESLFKPSEG